MSNLSLIQKMFFTCVPFLTSSTFELPTTRNENATHIVLNPSQYLYNPKILQCARKYSTAFISTQRDSVTMSLDPGGLITWIIF